MSRNVVSFRSLGIWAWVTLTAPAAGAEPALGLQHEAAIPFESAMVESADGQTFSVSWHAPRLRSVQIYAGTNPSDIGADRPVGSGTGDGSIKISNLPSATRWYFKLAPDRGEPLVIADRSLHLSTAGNFRDVGGYRTADGKWVRVGLIYRSNGLEHLTPAELDTIAPLHLKLVCDLRTDEERGRAPDHIPQGVADIPADVLADDAPMMYALIAGASQPNDGTQPRPVFHAQDIYRDFVRLKSAQSAYHLLFEKLADPQDLPTVFHCTAGKDRTGWADAVLLTILRVPRSTIFKDYELTSRYLQGNALKSVQASVNAPVRQSPLNVDPADLAAAFDEVTRQYGSFDNYLHQGLRLDNATLDAIRKNFLAG